MSRDASIRSGAGARGGSDSATAPRGRRRGALRRGPWAALAAAVAVLAAAPASALAGTLDQRQESDSGPAEVVADNVQWAQTFTAGIGGELDRVELLLSRQGDPGDLTVEIQTVNGLPPGTALDSAVVSQVSVPSTGANWIPVDLEAPSVAGTQYAIVLAAPGGDRFTDRYLWFGEVSGDPYGGGRALLSIDGGAIWDPGLEGADFAFRTFVEPDATIASLIEDVEGLGLPHGTERSLVAKLDGAEKNVDNGDLDEACEKLASFSDQVAALSGKKIDADDADGLIADAMAVREDLGCTP